MTTTHITICANDDCDNPALINAWPARKSGRCLAKICADCAAEFYTEIDTPGEAHAANSKLIKADTAPGIHRYDMPCHCGGIIELDHHGRIHHQRSEDNTRCRLRSDMTRSREIVKFADGRQPFQE